ncbi:hypothetical protein [Actinoplanes sp. NPDC026619]|uniref:hypothetical protein n=1 Tax=Actinoplanes sp. NPDC026619 TaxID=3155798 RepID=UPI00340361BA
MTSYLAIVAMGVLALLILTEIVAAALPVIIIIVAVPPEEREALAKLLAACDSSRKLRLWPALRLAVRARRQETKAPTHAEPSGEPLEYPEPPSQTVLSGAAPSGGELFR